MKKHTVVIGLGNPLMADEGIGVHLVQHLSDRAEELPWVEFVDGGTGGISILHKLADRRKAILIDCAYMGQKPGSICKFTPDEVASSKVLAHQSLHEADLLGIIDMARQLEQCPEQIVIFGIEPESVIPSLELSPALKGNLEHYISFIIEELESRDRV